MNNRETDYELLLKKYINHVGASEGVTFIKWATAGPCGTGHRRELDFTEEDIEALKKAEEDADKMWQSPLTGL
jgi:hypothetical protein